MAIHAIVGGLLSEATGGDFKTGAIAAGANEALVVQLDALVKGDPNLLTMSSQLVGLVAASAVDGDIEKGAWVAQNATQYNYLTHAQEAEKDREMEGCKEDKLCRVEKATKWALIDAQQDLGIVVGVGGGIGLSAAETVEGVLELVQHLPETVKALKQLASSPEFRQQFTDSYVSDLEQRAARLTQAYNDAGWQGSVTAGVEGARFAVELVGVLTAVRGTAQVAAKLPDAAKQVVNVIAEAPASGGWKAQVGAVGDLGKLEVPGGAKATSKVIAQYGPMNQGPLPKGIADTFRSGTYHEVVTTEPTKLYRVISDNGNPTGGYWTRTKPEGPVQSIIDSALDQKWGNTATKIVEMQVPIGSRLFEGVAAPQRGLVGGGNQIYFDKTLNPLKSDWIR
ncbi:hypothetical protein SA496_24260 [Pseudomonas sp. JS3066]|nr:hypothetical protein [Pseudomonas sp. JS3066]WVK92792.1 hypothetical protein SA496_24260 [Pseudomonas sp. JS3066]